MKTLFISTYDNLITIALLEDKKLIQIKEQQSMRSHSEYLMPLINEILKENNLIAQDLNEIIAINGPGSFTGIRLGITVAKTLAYTLNIPIKLITTIEALGISNANLDKKIITVADPKGKYYGIFENNQLIETLTYLNDSSFEDFLKENTDLLIISEQKLDIEKICTYLENQLAINPHSVKPIYIKQIEVQNG